MGGFTKIPKVQPRHRRLIIVSPSFLSLLFLMSNGASHAYAHPDVYRPLEHLAAGAQDLPSSVNTIILGAGIGSTLIAFSLDNSFRNYFANQDRLRGFENLGNLWGSPVISFGIGFGILGTGLAFERPYEIEVAKSLFEALFVDTALVLSLKVSVLRERPDGSDHYSFPSGHSSNAFTIAGNLMEMYGPAVGVPALGMGVLTQISRMASNVHYLSDTIFGAALGYIVGRSYAQHHLAREPGGLRDKNQGHASLRFTPYFESRSNFGIQAQMIF